jgi:hypothetical protein
VKLVGAERAVNLGDLLESGLAEEVGRQGGGLLEAGVLGSDFHLLPQVVALVAAAGVRLGSALGVAHASISITFKFYRIQAEQGNPTIIALL